MISTLQLLRSDENHIGSSPVTALTGINSVSNKSSTEQAGKSNFESYLLDALSYVNGKQQSRDDIAQQLIVDPDSVDVHDVTIAMAEANLSLSMAQAVIDRMIKGWSEITTTK